MKAISLKNLSESVLFIDGECVMCRGFSRWVLKNTNITISTLQSSLAEEIPEKFKKIDSLVFYKNNQFYIRSESFFEVVSESKYKALLIFRWVPLNIRDWAYDIIAANRKKIFREKGSCQLPPVKYRKRIIY